ncbi:MAG: GxxExxY protein [Chlamydiales bacterium]|nr:GxxExxY protein [Chlamydiales bacterium]
MTLTKINETRSHRDTESAFIHNDLSYKIIGAAIEVHKVLGGPGLLESVYESALCHELSLQGCKFKHKSL